MDKEIDFKELERRWEAIKKGQETERQKREFQDYSNANLPEDREKESSDKKAAEATLRESREFRSYSRQ
ncbi:hypothetical protein [Zunongwangia atlantica]|uniref:Uncharacterized protein n=1 Tax=Zunongwangia atlantica 22II14-10F7 TaxID=1185767 RepID=A0A1Y1T0D0_9FLAO|nr:hypothetical protein [Zunongwangia atlantica]ORL44469.1 hypothetical protein IIF7_15840 [Zunongwangia atlantica 22II14-10F7]